MVLRVTKRQLPPEGERCDASSASQIDRTADVLLQQGFHGQAERLAQRAEDLRAGGAA
jgi:hypothetical protein